MFILRDSRHDRHCHLETTTAHTKEYIATKTQRLPAPSVWRVLNWKLPSTLWILTVGFFSNMTVLSTRAATHCKSLVKAFSEITFLSLFQILDRKRECKTYFVYPFISLIKYKTYMLSLVFNLLKYLYIYTKLKMIRFQNIVLIKQNCDSESSFAMNLIASGQLFRR